VQRCCRGLVIVVQLDVVVRLLLCRRRRRRHLVFISSNSVVGEVETARDSDSMRRE
jgi:nucleoside-diphosphate-sugar epimerase